jgi:hypothetical protein
MPDKLTEKQKTDYVEGGYNACPKCLSEDISGGNIEADANYCWRPVECKNPECEHEWTENFTMTSIEDDD